MIETAEWQKKIEAMQAVLAGEAAEAVAIMQKHEEPVLRFAHRLLAVVRITIQEHTDNLPNTGWPVVLVALFTSMVSALRGALTLARTGHGRELPILIRPALEALITLLFIAKENSALRARRWMQFAYVAKYKLMKKHPHLFRGPEHRNARRRIRGRARRVEQYFPNDKFWASGLHYGSLRHMAEKVGLLWHYDSVYWAGSQPTHASAIGVEEHIGVGPDGTPAYKIGLSGQGVHREMAVYCDLMIRGLDAINSAVALGVASIIADLKSEYAVAFQGDPLTQQIEEQEEKENT